jgi:hypothetical protein
MTTPHDRHQPYPVLVSRLTAENADLQDRLKARDELIHDLSVENERLLRELALADALADSPMDMVA